MTGGEDSPGWNAENEHGNTNAERAKKREKGTLEDGSELPELRPPYHDATLPAMAEHRSLARRIHNPRNRQCACDPDCWCRRTRVGRLVKWWFPARYFRLRHKNSRLEEWRRSRPAGALEAWKRERGERPELGPDS